MDVLLDTHLLLWAGISPQRLSPRALGIIEDPANRLYFSAASLWEVAIKASLGRADFTVDAARLRRGLERNGYAPLAVQPAHAVAVAQLPPLHKDPFDRLLIAQARVEGLLLITADHQVADYGASVLRI